MRNELHSNLGFYSSSFLKMHIQTGEQLADIFTLSAQESAAFIHEYVHFLQDITTIYGQRNIISVVQYIKSVNFNQRGSDQRNLWIPYMPDREIDPRTFDDIALQKVLVGTTAKIDADIIKSVNPKIIKLKIGDDQTDVERIELTVKNEESSFEYKYCFGSHAVMESMAFVIEQMTYPGELEDPKDFCYRAAGILIKFLYPEMSNEPLYVIALCDACLMYHNPAAVFYNMLSEMKSENYIPVSANDIYKFVDARVQVNFYGLSKVDQIFNNHTLTAMNELKGYFTSEFFAPNKEWVDYTFRKANEIRRNEWGFFLTVALGGPIPANLAFRQLFSGLGMALVTNNKGEAFFASPVSNQELVRPDILWVIHEIYHIYLNSNDSRICRCHLLQWCKESCRHVKIEDYTDHRCIESPWERIKDNSDLCVFSQVWKTWGLENEIPCEKR
jgi:hypothetical protein